MKVPSIYVEKLAEMTCSVWNVCLNYQDEIVKNNWGPLPLIHDGLGGPGVLPSCGFTKTSRSNFQRRYEDVVSTTAEMRLELICVYRNMLYCVRDQWMVRLYPPQPIIYDWLASSCQMLAPTPIGRRTRVHHPIAFHTSLPFWQDYIDGKRDDVYKVMGKWIACQPIWIECGEAEPD